MNSGTVQTSNSRKLCMSVNLKISIGEICQNLRMHSSLKFIEKLVEIEKTQIRFVLVRKMMNFLENCESNTYLRDICLWFEPPDWLFEAWTVPNVFEFLKRLPLWRQVVNHRAVDVPASLLPMQGYKRFPFRYAMQNDYYKEYIINDYR